MQQSTERRDVLYQEFTKIESSTQNAERGTRNTKRGTQLSLFPFSSRFTASCMEPALVTAPELIK